MNGFDSIIKRMAVTHVRPEDYTGEDGLLYCGKCRTPKQFRMDKPPLEGCQCQYEIVRKRRRNFVVFRRQGGDKIKRFLAQKECSRFAASGA